MSTPTVTDPPLPPVGLVLLAAGASRRLGTPKQLLRDAAGVSLVRRAALTAAASGCHPIVAVLGASAAEVGGELREISLTMAVNPDWRTGMASSLKTGLAAVAQEVAPDAVIVMLCDQPLVTAALLRSLIESHRASGAEVVASEYGDGLGVPALFGRSVFGSLAALSGDQGARHIIRAYSGSVARVPFPGSTFDVDTSEDAERFGHFPARG